MPNEDGGKSAGGFAAVVIVLVVGATSALTLVGARTRGTQGARLSTRLQWEERRIELQEAATRAEAEGSLRLTHRPVAIDHE